MSNNATLDRIITDIGPRPARWHWLALRRWHQKLSDHLMEDLFRSTSAQERLLFAMRASQDSADFPAAHVRSISFLSRLTEYIRSIMVRT